MTKHGVTGIALAVVACFALPALAQNGWVVRVCRGFTDAADIKISVGKPGGKSQLLVNWQSDAKETDFPLSDEMLSGGKELHVTADSEPANGKVAMCVLYKGKPVKAMNFTDLLEVTASQTGTDTNCKCPKSGGQ
jgi:hypothetical protein